MIKVAIHFTDNPVKEMDVTTVIVRDGFLILEEEIKYLNHGDDPKRSRVRKHITIFPAQRIFKVVYGDD